MVQLVVTPSPRAPHRYSHSRLQISREASPCSSLGRPPPSPSPSTPPSDSSPGRASTTCPLISLCIGNRKILKPSFSFRNGRNFFRKSSGQRERERLSEKTGALCRRVTDVSECRGSCHVSSDQAGDSKCQCRKCSLISLGDVDTREVHSMIRFIKQNKVCTNHHSSYILQSFPDKFFTYFHFQFKRMLNKELSHFSESKSGNQISEYICNTFLGEYFSLSP